MKAILTLGVVAVVLFTAAAALTTWLTTQKPTDNTKETASKKKSKDKGDDGDSPPPIVRPSVPPGSDINAKTASELNESQARLRDRLARLESRERQVEVVLQDIMAERDAVESIRTKLAEELRQIAARNAELDKRLLALDDRKKQVDKDTLELEKGRVLRNKDEDVNLVKLAALYDAMPAENAAKILQEMTDRGKMDTAVKILAQMKPSKSSRLLAEMSDAGLASQLLDRMKGLKTTPPEN